MDNAQKAIMIGVGLFITIIVIAAVMLITGMGQDILNSGTQQLGNVTEKLNNSVIDTDAQKLNKSISYLEARTMAQNAFDAGIPVTLDDKSVTDKSSFVSSKSYKPTDISSTAYKFKTN